MISPTRETYEELQTAYTHFNRELFGSALPLCLITLQRRKGTYGYLNPARFVNHSGDRADEIALNPAYFAVRRIEAILSTLVHEMVHQWQVHYGKPGRGRYHNKEWSTKMQALGLQPSDTGKPGGKATGDCMDHYVITDGPFASSAARLITDPFRLSWLDRFPENQPATSPDVLDTELVKLGITALEPLATSRGKAKFTCARCRVNAWGKPALKLICGACGQTMPAQD